MSANQKLGAAQARPAADRRARPPAAARPDTADCRRSPPTPPRTAHRSPLHRPRRGPTVAHGALAQQRRAQRPPPPRARTPQETRPHRRRLDRTQRHQHPHAPAPPTARQICQPPQRGLIRPMRIVNGDQQRPAVCEIGSQPVQAMQHRKRRVDRPTGPASSPNSNGRAAPAGPASSASRSSRSAARQAPLKQLTHHAEREIRLKLRTTRQQDLHARAPPPGDTPASTSDVLPIPTPPSTRRTPPRALQQLLDRRQLPLALEQLLHKDQSNPISGDQHELQSATVVLGVAKRQHHQGRIPTLPRRVCPPTRRPARPSHKTRTNRAKPGSVPLLLAYCTAAARATVPVLRTSGTATQRGAHIRNHENGSHLRSTCLRPPASASGHHG